MRRRGFLAALLAPLAAPLILREPPRLQSFVVTGIDWATGPDMTVLCGLRKGDVFTIAGRYVYDE